MNNLNIYWQKVLEALRTENMIEFFTNRDPVALATDPWVIVPAVAVIVGLYCTKFKKFAAVLIGLCVMWVGFYYGIPEEGAPIDLKTVVTLGGTFVGVGAYWIYVFLIQD